MATDKIKVAVRVRPFNRRGKNYMFFFALSHTYLSKINCSIAYHIYTDKNIYFYPHSFDVFYNIFTNYNMYSFKLYYILLVFIYFLIR